MQARGWDTYDFLLITGDAYVDHPSFAMAVIGRVLEDRGYRVCIAAQPPYQTPGALEDIGRPRLGVLISGGNLDSMVAHYTAAKRPRRDDAYTPGGKAGKRPDRATIVYANLAKSAFPGVPVIIGGLEASLRRFAHYDYWSNKVRRGILFDAKADLLIYGMGETAICDVADRLNSGTPIHEICDIRGTAYITKDVSSCVFPMVACAGYDDVAKNKAAYATATKMQWDEHDPVRGKATLQPHGDRTLVVNPPAHPLDDPALDRVYDLPYTREIHPSYDAHVSAIDEVRFSVIHNRGCFGSCSFCALGFHQGRVVTARSHASILREVEGFVRHPLFKGYVHDVGGPTANFRRAACKHQAKRGSCKHRNCLTPDPCGELDADHTDYLKLLRKIRMIPGVKRVFIRSGIRFDFLLADTNGECFAEIVHYHVSGQLKVAPEHMVDRVLDVMQKPRYAVFERFSEKFRRLNQKYGKEQYLVPYLMSSHPGSTLEDAIALAQMLHKQGKHPEQVQDFYPTPGTISTAMYHTGLDPFSGRPVYVAREERERAMQRALLQWRNPEKQHLILAALRQAGREDLIGFSKHCLVKPQKRAPRK